MNGDRKPLPRFWYFPRSLKAVVVSTGDDHGNGGTATRFNEYASHSPAGCSVANWECLRKTSYVYPNTPLTNAQASTFASQGFEVGLHPQNNCSDFTATSLESTYATQLAQWRPEVPQPSGSDDEPVPLHASGATGSASRRLSWRTASGWTPTTTTGRATRALPGLGEEPARAS